MVVVALITGIHRHAQAQGRIMQPARRLRFLPKQGENDGDDQSTLLIKSKFPKVSKCGWL